MPPSPQPRATDAGRPLPVPQGTPAPWLVKVDGIAYGGDYTPEQWPEETWPDDVALMREAGVNLVSIGIFSWALLEPEEARFDFGWLDRIIELLHAGGIRIDLGTPTASPPAWFFHTHPEARVVTREGTVLGFGSRGMAGPSSPAYRTAALRITTALAKRYGRHPALALWHVHNEYGAPVAEDYSPESAAAFRQWLEARYRDLEHLNEAWGTTFWGQHYTRWEHVGPPAATPSVANPTQRLDFARFSDHALRACFVAERDAIRAHSDVPVTTNFMAGNCPSTELWQWAREVDIVSNDHYLTASQTRPEIGLAFAADLTRSLAGGRPWILMEHSPSAVSWQPRNVAKQPGQMTRNAVSHLGRGADAILFFQWRASRSGAEKFHSAMLPHAGTGSRVWREVVALGRDLCALSEVQGSRVRAEIAILWDQESFWAQELEWRPSVDLDHRERIDAFYTALWQAGHTVDFAHPEADLTAYRLVLAPASYLLSRAAAANLTRYVAAGGTLLVSYFSGIVDETDTVHEGGYLAPLRDALGLTVEEFLPLREGESVQLGWTARGGDWGGTGAGDPSTTELQGSVWTDDISLEGAEIVATYLDGPAAGRPAITRHVHGEGTAWYVSTRLDVDAIGALLDPVYRDAGLTAWAGVAGLEVIVRHGTEVDYLVAINHGDVPVAVAVDGRELLTDRATEGTLKVPAGGVAAVRVTRRVTPSMTPRLTRP
ncbi:MAG: beta-galactosidase [Lapillicoccus sp.]